MRWTAIRRTDEDAASLSGTTRAGRPPVNTTRHSEVLWENQHHFRWSLERLVNEALDAAGTAADPRASLIGFPLGVPGEVVVEPLRGAFDTEPLSGVLELAGRRFRGHEAQATAPEDPPARTSFLNELAEHCRVFTLTEALTAAARSGHRRYLVGRSAIVGDHRIFPVISVDRDAWHEAPMLHTPADVLDPVERSFTESVVRAALDVATYELGRREPLGVTNVEPTTILHAAADSFVAGVLRLTGQEFGQGARQAIDLVSSQPYEGRDGAGGVVLARPGHPDVAVEIEFETPVSMRTTGSFRKVLEMAGQGLSLLSDGRTVHGLGWLDPSYDSARQDCFVCTISHNGSWELVHGTTPYLRVDNGLPSLPRDQLGAEEFADVVERLFGGVEGRDATRLWDVAEACARQSLGTMLVVHPDAAHERERLMPQAYAIRPARLAGRALQAATSIDGAVLVSPDGRCHAVGVILDGEATGTGDAARGSRYNSAIRYLAGAGKGSMVIIVSEDGRIDLLPRLMRRIRRTHVERVVGRLVEAAGDDTDFETFARLDRYAQGLEFYFDQNQCDAVNAARERVEERQWTEEGMRVTTVPISPDPAMDPSYYLVEG